MIRQYELVERVAAYDPNVDEALLNRAYVFSLTAHGGQKRASGDPYFSHPVEVAAILSDYRLDTATIVTALLHDTVEDTVATIEQLEQLFGREIAQLVDGVTKLSELELRSGANHQAENFRKLLLAMSNDIRVLLVKLADRLHNMRTIGFLRKEETRKRIAAETMEIYAPLAGRLGMHQIRLELEDLSFEQLNPEARRSVIRRLEYLRGDGDGLIERISESVKNVMDEAGIAATVSGREKVAYSIWRKMERDNISFEHLSDTVGFRVIVDSIPDCYQALGVVHGSYPMVPGRFKDYVSTPKRNNYRSIHTTVIGPEQRRIEIQIRTKQMNEIAEFGVAAHWQYKQNLEGAESGQYRWLQELLEILENANNPDEFLEHTKLEMFPDQVFCFTPRGDVIALPRGATPVDFAYAVHTDVGDSCVGAKVNGRTSPLRTELRNGDQVEVLRATRPAPNPVWESFVITGKARSSIRRFIRVKERGEFRELGRAIAEKAFRESGHEYSERALENVVQMLHVDDVDAIYVALGGGELTSQELLDKLFPGERRWNARGALGAINRMIPNRLRPGKAARKGRGESVPIAGLTPGLAVHFAVCCHPLPGDRIVGIMTKGKGAVIHTIDCEQLEESKPGHDSWIDVRWELDPEDPDIFVGTVDCVVTNEPGSLSSLSSVIAKNLGNISNLKITDRNPDFFEMRVDIEVADVKHLINIIAALRATPCIGTVERVRG